MLEDDKVTTKVLDSTEYSEVVTTKGSKMIDAFLSRIKHTQMKTTFTSARLNVMTPALHAEEGPLLQGLMIQNAYTGMCNGSKNVAIVVRNNMAYPQTLKKKIPVARVVVCQLGAWAAGVVWHDRCIGWGPRHPDTEADHRTEAGEAVWEVRLEWLGILAVRASRFHSFTPGWIPWHFLLRTLLAQLHSFDQTCD